MIEPVLVNEVMQRRIVEGESQTGKALRKHCGDLVVRGVREMREILHVVVKKNSWRHRGVLSLKRYQKRACFEEVFVANCL